MPNVRKLSREEVRTIERKTLGLRKAIEAEYDAFLSGFSPGDYGEAMLDGAEKRLTVRSRLKAAAGRAQPELQLTFLRTRAPDVIRFKVAEAGAEPAAPPAAAPAPVLGVVSTDAPPAAPRRGRPPKSAAAAPAAAAPVRRARKSSKVA